MTLDTLLKIVGQNIARLRKSKVLKQQEAASTAGISYRYYQTIEAGKANLRLSTLHSLARFFGVPTAKLLDPQPSAVGDRAAVTVPK